MSNIPVGHEPWVGIRVFFDEVGNSFNDPAQQVFAFSALVFASEHEMFLAKWDKPGSRNLCSRKVHQFLTASSASVL